MISKPNFTSETFHLPNHHHPHGPDCLLLVVTKLSQSNGLIQFQEIDSLFLEKDMNQICQSVYFKILDLHNTKDQPIKKRKIKRKNISSESYLSQTIIFDMLKYLTTSSSCLSLKYKIQQYAYAKEIMIITKIIKTLYSKGMLPQSSISVFRFGQSFFCSRSP